MLNFALIILLLRARQGKVLAARPEGLIPRTTWWKVRTNSAMLSSGQQVIPHMNTAHTE